MDNDPDELARFKAEINLTEYAASCGYQLDKRESSRNSAVMRHPDGDKIIIAQTGQHWVYFSVRDDHDNGTVIDFVTHREGRGSIGKTRQILRQWTGSPRPKPATAYYVQSLAPTTHDRAAVLCHFMRLQPINHHPALTGRGITPALLTRPRFAGCVYSDERRNACFPHYDQDGLAGWEMKNRNFTGYAAGGSKGLWFSKTKPTDAALVIAESALDALSYAALFPDDQTRYFSTGGSLNPNQPALIAAALAKMPQPAALILATDNDPAGDALADQIRTLVPDGLEVRRPRPEIGKDWNDQLQAQTRRPEHPARAPRTVTDAPEGR